MHKNVGEGLLMHSLRKLPPQRHRVTETEESQGRFSVLCVSVVGIKR